MCSKEVGRKTEVHNHLCEGIGGVNGVRSARPLGAQLFGQSITIGVQLCSQSSTRKLHRACTTQALAQEPNRVP